MHSSSLIPSQTQFVSELWVSISQQKQSCFFFFFFFFSSLTEILFPALEPHKKQAIFWDHRSCWIQPRTRIRTGLPLTNTRCENQSSHPRLLILNQMAPGSSKLGPWDWKKKWLHVGKGREPGGMLWARFINSFLSTPFLFTFPSQGDLHKSHHERTFIIIIIIVIILGCVLTDASERVTCHFFCLPDSQCLRAKNILLSNYSRLFS